MTNTSILIPQLTPYRSIQLSKQCDRLELTQNPWDYFIENHEQGMLRLMQPVDL